MDDGESPRTTATGSEGELIPRTYLFTLTDAGGTVPPELGVVRRVVERGHRVTVVAADSIVDCLQRITDALAGLPVRGLVTTGPAVEPEVLRASANVAVVASAPHRLVLPQVDVVVTHGGHGTVIKALASGVPLVILHHGRDQADNAARVTARGAGVAIPRTASAQRIATAVTDVLRDPAYRRSAARLGEAITREAESGKLVSELERL